MVSIDDKSVGVKHSPSCGPYPGTGSFCLGAPCVPAVKTIAGANLIIGAGFYVGLQGQARARPSDSCKPVPPGTMGYVNN